MRWSLMLLMLVAGCRSSLSFSCASDSQCGADSSCIAGACALVDATCPSGYRLDRSAGSGAGQCVALVVVDDMAIEMPDIAAPIDIAEPLPPDMVTPLDMTLTCAQQGNPCSVGLGACARTGTILCSAGGAASCSATAGAPDTSGTWHQAAATNGSWDWDCDGAVEYQFPSGDSTPPANDDASVSLCRPLASQPVCTAPHWFYPSYHPWPVPCGHPVYDALCVWANNACDDQQPPWTSITEGCR